MAGKWVYRGSLYSPGRVPVVTDMVVKTSETYVVGDLLIFDTGTVAKAGDAIANVVGIAYEAVTSASSGDLAKVAILQPGDIIEGTADADASSLLMGARLVDINATTQTLDVADTTNGCFQVIKIVSADGLTVQVTSSEFGVGLGGG